MSASVSVDLSGVVAGFKNFKAKQLPFAAAMALTATVKAAAAAEQVALFSVFDRPTPFTAKGVGVTTASKSKLSASVFVKPIQASYLTLEETGGTRTPAKRALLMPVDAKRNAYGNLPRRALQALKNRKDVFVGTVNGVGGVWQRTSSRSGRRGRRGSKGKGIPVRTGLQLLVAFDDEATYKPRFGFRVRAIQVMRATLPGALKAAMAKAMASAR